MLDQETLDDLVSLAKRVENQVSKRALRAIATREIADAFKDCDIHKSERLPRRPQEAQIANAVACVDEFPYSRRR